MKKQILWIVVSGLMVLSLVMSACGPAAEEEGGEIAEEEVVSEETPKYGGTLYYYARDPVQFDEFYSPRPLGGGSLYFTQSRLLTGDWGKGLAGTSETDWKYGIVGQVSLFTGDVAEGWELIQPDTLMFYIREGVYWALNPDSEASVLVGGREFTADDAAYSLTHHFLDSEMSAMSSRFKGVGDPPKSIKAIDKYTVEVVVPEHLLGNMVVMMGNFTNMVCSDVIEEYGDLKNWRNAVGTGPWMMMDYVPGSEVVYEKNPTYHMVDPIHPENQLPYVDKITALDIPDLSTRQAAFRTGKIDLLSGITWEDAEIFRENRPDLQEAGRLSVFGTPAGRMDKDLPFNDIRVRQAMNLAVNQQELLEHYYGGYGELFALPVPPTASHQKLFTPLEELSIEPSTIDTGYIAGSCCSVPELFTHNPEKARQLLTEAGYPDGFKTEIIAYSAYVDFLAMIQAYLADIGIDMQIDVRERAVHTKLHRERNYEEMMNRGGLSYSFPQTMLAVTATYDNPSFINWDETDERINEAYKIVVANVGVNDDLWQATLKELYPYILETAWGIWLPGYYSYTMWQPWFQNYHGEGSVGYFDPPRYLQYVWLDMELKKELGY